MSGSSEGPEGGTMEVKEQQEIRAGWVPSCTVRKGDRLMISGIRAVASQDAFRSMGEEFILYWKVEDYGPTGAIYIRGYAEVKLGWDSDG